MIIYQIIACVRTVVRPMSLSSIIQKRTAPTSPNMPAIPKVDTEEPGAAPLALLAVLPLVAVAALVPELDAVNDVPLDDPLGEPVLVGEGKPDPLSLIAVLRQLLLVPAFIVTWAEKAWAPVLSLRATLKLVLA